jgi:serine/threonine protein kinase
MATPDGPVSEAVAPSSAGSSKTLGRRCLKAKLDGLEPWMLHPRGVLLYAAFPMVVPRAFESVSREVRDVSREGMHLEDELRVLAECHCVLVFCEGQDQSQVQRIVDMFSCIEDHMGENCPPILIVPHSEVLHETLDEEKEAAAWSNLIELGFDGVVLGEHKGPRFALEVRCALMRRARNLEVVEEALTEHMEKVEHAQKLEQCIHNTLWEYFRHRRGCGTIPRQQDLGLIEPGTKLGKYSVGAERGKGTNGTVCVLETKDIGDGSFKQVVKLIKKSEHKTVHHVKDLIEEVRVMQMLSSDQWQHKNIVMLHAVFHSNEQIIFQMEDGGPKNLFAFLRTKERLQLPLGYNSANSIIMQCAQALCHMHLGPKIVHQDLKPENILTDGVNIKLCDFGFARIMGSRRESHRRVLGTFPFIAPEMLDRSKPVYDPFAADIWSLGMVSLEVLCRCSVMTQVACPADRPENSAQHEEYTAAIRDFLQYPNNLRGLLHTHARAELQEHDMSKADAMVQGMLDVQVDRRWTADTLESRLQCPIVLQPSLPAGRPADGKHFNRGHRFFSN